MGDEIRGPTVWSCKNGHFHTRENGTACPVCGSYLEFPHEENTPIRDSSNVQKVVDDGEIPQTSESAIREWNLVDSIVSGLNELHLINFGGFQAISGLRQGEDEGESQADANVDVEQVLDFEIPIPTESDEDDVLQCRFGHLITEGDDNCFFCGKSQDDMAMGEMVIYLPNTPSP